MIACLVLVLVALPGAVLAATTLLMVYEARVHGQAEASPPCGPLIGAWFAEYLALLGVIALRPFALLPAKSAQPGGGQRPVALVHELGCGRASMAMLAARLRRDGRDAVLVGYSHDRAAHTEITSQRLVSQLRRVAEDAGTSRIDVVAHGFGGILLRTIARRYRGTELFGYVVTIATPHSGTSLAHLVSGRAAVELRPESGYLLRLADEDPLPGPLRLTNIVSTFDALVFPPALAYYKPALNITVETIGHFSMVFSARVYDLVWENLGQEPETARSV